MNGRIFLTGIKNSMILDCDINAVQPGPVWTSLITSSFNKEKVAEHGRKSPMGRPGKPVEVMPCYLFLASDDSSYMSGQVLHPNGGEIING